jgi:hypothetical protein
LRTCWPSFRGATYGNSSTASLLQKCILLGGQVGSERLRDWARQELKGYDRVDQVPEYRRVSACAVPKNRHKA